VRVWGFGKNALECAENSDFADAIRAIVTLDSLIPANAECRMSGRIL
jgi:hypothetical protein